MTKRLNLYAQLYFHAYDETPKAVLAAVAVSFASASGDHLDEATVRIVTEWHILHQNGIVPQPVPGKLRHYVGAYEPEEQGDNG